MVSEHEDLRALKRAIERDSRITVWELRQRLASFDDDDEITFGTAYEGRNPLAFRRIKNRGPIDGPGLVSFEFDELTDDEVRALCVVEPGLD